VRPRTAKSHATSQCGLTLIEVLAAAAVVALVAAGAAPMVVRVSSVTRSSGDFTRHISDIGAYANQLSVRSATGPSCSSPPAGTTCSTAASGVTLDRSPWSARLVTNSSCQGRCSMPTSRLTADVYEITSTAAPVPALRVAAPNSP